MHARTVRSEGSPEGYEQMRQVLTDQVIPSIQQFPGFQGAYWVGDRAAGKGIGFFFYAGADKLKETAERADKLRAASAQAGGVTITAVKEHEVIADTGEKVHTTATHMRVTTLRSDPAHREEAIARVKDTVIPTVQGFPGFAGGFWLTTLDGQEALGCTLWESQQALEGSRPKADELRQGAAASTGSQVTQVEEFEIVARTETPVTAGS